VTILTLVALLISVFTGSWLGKAFCGGSSGSATVWKHCLSMGVGTIVGSYSMLLSLLLSGGRLWALVIIDLGLTVTSWWFMRLQRRGPAERTDRSSARQMRIGHFTWGRVTVAAAMGAMTAAASVAAGVWIVAPHGWWDAWYIWNIRARFLFRGGTNWASAFADTGALIHRDYPLLLPLTVSRLWRYLGDDSTVVPRAVALLFGGMTVGLLFSSLSALRGRSHGCLAIVTLLSVGFFAYSGANQTADVPLAFYMLGTFAALVMERSAPESRGAFFTLAGLMAGGAAWTKNEGILFCGLVVIATVVVWAVQSGWEQALRVAGRVILGMTPMLGVLLVFKVLVPVNYLFEPYNRSVMLQKPFELSRHAEIVQSIVAVFPGVFDPLVIALLTAYVLVAGLSDRRLYRPAATIILLVLIGQVGGYYLAYLMSPFAVLQQASPSMDRLMMQLWPSAVFLLFLETRTLEETSEEPGTARTQEKPARRNGGRFAVPFPRRGFAPPTRLRQHS
jgi:hypothetical protein